MFIQCSDCEYKYLVNSADLKPGGRMVECANCNHHWFQELHQEQDQLFSSVPKTTLIDKDNKIDEIKNDEDDILIKPITNLPSTVVRDQKVSTLNSFLVIFLLVFIFFIFWTFKVYGKSIFVLIDFYVNEFFFNLKLIIDDLAKIIHQILN